jgi:septal ring factor EnvC (AmiA/AmiB activator)
MKFFSTLAVLWYLFFGSSGVWAEEVVSTESKISEEQIEGRLRAIRDRVHTSQELLRSLERQQFQLERDLRTTEGVIKELGVKQAEIELAMEANQSRQEELEREKLDIQQERNDLFILFRQRVYALYLKSRGIYGVTPSLFQQTKGIDQQVILYGKIVARHDNNVLKTLTQLNARLQHAQTALLEEGRQSRSLLYQYEKLVASLFERQAQRKDIAEQVQAREDKVKLVIRSLQAEALRLEHFVNSLTMTPERLQADEPSRAKLVVSGVYQGDFDGPGLQKPIAQPVVGSVKRRFGKEEIVEFAGYVMRKGVVFGADGSGEVRSVAAGIVRFVGELPGFDNVIIVDHGKRDYSLYGRLQQTQVESGALVKQGQMLAFVDSEERELYFEVRHNGVPHDPEKFFEQSLAVQN